MLDYACGLLRALSELKPVTMKAVIIPWTYLKLCFSFFFLFVVFLMSTQHSITVWFKTAGHFIFCFYWDALLLYYLYSKTGGYMALSDQFKEPKGLKTLADTGLNTYAQKFSDV